MKNTITQEDINSILERTHWTIEEFHGNECLFLLIFKIIRKLLSQ